MTDKQEIAPQDEPKTGGSDWILMIGILVIIVIAAVVILAVIGSSVGNIFSNMGGAL